MTCPTVMQMLNLIKHDYPALEMIILLLTLDYILNVINAKQLQFALSKLAFVTMLKKIHFTAVTVIKLKTSDLFLQDIKEYTWLQCINV